jgi:hypothetical protein
VLGCVDGRRDGQVARGGLLQHVGESAQVTVGDVDQVLVIDPSPDPCWRSVRDVDRGVVAVYMSGQRLGVFTHVTDHMRRRLAGCPSEPGHRRCRVGNAAPQLRAAGDGVGECGPGVRVGTPDIVDGSCGRGGDSFHREQPSIGLT